ncbi:MAG: hypothetical protein ACREFE_12845, partial [Limisphaerales bacterium]
ATPRISREPKLLAAQPVFFLMTGSDEACENFLEATSLYIERIRVRAETVTPLLREILNFRPHWVFNE